MAPPIYVFVPIITQIIKTVGDYYQKKRREKMLKGLTSWTKTSEGVLAYVLAIVALFFPDFPKEAFYTAIAYILGRSWVKTK